VQPEKFAMTVQKWSLLVLYAGMAIAAVMLAGTPTATVIQWVFVVLVVVHLLEFVVVFKMLKSATGSMVGHLVQTPLFGYFHWSPIKQGQ
jgi:uncharacterized protein YhhL (DUF1145 family)